jgi:hypothetical protein
MFPLKAFLERSLDNESREGDVPAGCLNNIAAQRAMVE